MSDLEEMDSEKLNELESILYASIHYNDTSCEQQEQSQQQQQQQLVYVSAMDVDTQSMPPPPQQSEQKQQLQHNRFVSNRRVINNAPAKPRYWLDGKSVTIITPLNDSEKKQTSLNKTAEVTPTEQSSSSTRQSKIITPSAPDVHHTPKNKPSVDSTSKKAVTNSHKKPKSFRRALKLLMRQQQERPQPQKKQREQLQTSPQCSKKQSQAQKPSKQQQQPQTSKTREDEPERFDQRLLVAIPSNTQAIKRDKPLNKAQRKLEQLQRIAAKREKSKRARANKNKRTEDKTIELISLIESDKSDVDDVIIVPIPPAPIIDVVDSDEEKRQPYLEENAMDATDVQLGVVCSVDQGNIASILHSPSSSVLSSDDFIVQKDTSRLMADRARATDEDLLVLTENAIRNAAEPIVYKENEQNPDQAVDTSSEYEFVPPSRLEEIKQNYRVDEQQFRALDVYESESDLTESGIYCKAKQKTAPTIIRSVDSESDMSDVEQVVEATVNKTKRRHKRRASSTNQSQSDPNIDDTDSDAEVQETGVPGIARGMAVERCKRKIRRISQRRSSESAVPVAARKAPEIEISSESATEEALPTARQIAERLLNQKQSKDQFEAQAQYLDTQSDVDEESIGTDANSQDEAEMQDAITERISALFKRIDSRTHNVQQQQDMSTIVEEPEMQVDNVEQESDEAEPLAEQLPDSELNTVVQVKYSLTLSKPVIGSDLVGWNDEMCRFYNDSWHGEYFNVQKIQKAMNAQRSEWKIVAADRFPVVRRRVNLKCTNCFEMGHIRARCPRPRKPVTCTTCGMKGHSEPRCPNAICLGCGAKHSAYVQKCNKCAFYTHMNCQLCKMRGHSTDMCPDKWRRYHSTTRSNVVLNNHVKYRAKNCSYCGARGHLFEECGRRIGEYRNTNYTNQIISYQKVYNDRSGPISYMTDLSDFFNISTPFHFKWSSDFSKSNCYARFLKAVGLARPADKPKKRIMALGQKIYTNDYVPNPQVTATLGKSNATSSVIIEELPPKETEAPEVATTNADLQIQQKEISSNSPNKPVDAKARSKPSSTIIITSNKCIAPPHDLDSDSNYSFSEHFEMPSSTTNSSENEIRQNGSMDNLPDIIPLSTMDNGENTDDVIMSNNSQGISICVNNAASSLTSRSATQPDDSLPDVPSEAKIIMARDQIEYLFSPEGRQFLIDAAQQCNVEVRMDFKEYGYVLIIYGLKRHQEDLQMKLLHRNQEVKRKTSDFQSQKPPKRIDVLIRFIREGIISLTGDLGNPKSHYVRIKELERMNTKNSFKLAERKRRLLNMILFGQAGLNNGNMHLDQLIIILKQLLARSKDENATPALRSTIEEHWRVIFSAQSHQSYDALLYIYSQLDVKNRLLMLDIDPAILGQQGTRKLHSPQKRNQLSSPIPPPPIWEDEERAPPAPSMYLSPHINNTNSNNHSQNQWTPPPPSMYLSPQINNTNSNNRSQKQRAPPAPSMYLSPQISNTISNNRSQNQWTPPPPTTHLSPQITNNNSNNRSQKQRAPPAPSMYLSPQISNTNSNNRSQNQWTPPAAPTTHLSSQINNTKSNNRSQKQRTQVPNAKTSAHQRPLPPVWQHEVQTTASPPSMQQQNINNKNRQAKQRLSPYTNPRAQQNRELAKNNNVQRVPSQLKLQDNRPLESECVKLLAGMERSEPATKSVGTDASKPSLFWSRESMKYLDHLFQFTTNRDTVVRLNRVVERSRRGELSHNDYRAVIRLHALMEPN